MKHRLFYFLDKCGNKTELYWANFGEVCLSESAMAAGQYKITWLFLDTINSDPIDYDCSWRTFPENEQAEIQEVYPEVNIWSQLSTFFSQPVINGAKREISDFGSFQFRSTTWSCVVTGAASEEPNVMHSSSLRKLVHALSETNQCFHTWMLHLRQQGFLRQWTGISRQCRACYSQRWGCGIA